MKCVEELFYKFKDQAPQDQPKVLTKCTGVYTSAKVTYQSESLVRAMTCYYFYGLGSSKGYSSFRQLQFMDVIGSDGVFEMDVGFLITCAIPRVKEYS
jgi:hypothetical protein